MSHNSFGHLFRVTTWGESHGPALGCVVDGTPPGIPLDAEDIQCHLDKRRPGQSRFVTQRKEPDLVRILSGVFAPDGKQTLTTGTPLCLLIENVDQRPRDYSAIRDSFRPGHADYGYACKYGIRDHRGGGRASARETAARVAAGAVARKVLDASVTVRAAVVQIGPHRIDHDRWSWDAVDDNPFFCPDSEAAARWEGYIDQLRRDGSSAGAVIHVEAQGVPAGWGAPVYGKLDAAIAHALMSINAVKAVEIGAGLEASVLSGEDNADQMRIDEGAVSFLSNNNGGIAGGISTGQPIIARMTVKPTSSVRIPRKSISAEGSNVEVTTQGRHDPCVGIRAAPVAEAMLACVLADQKLRHRGQIGTDPVYGATLPTLATS